MIPFWAAVGALAITFVIPTFPPEPPRVYDVVISPEFTPLQVLTVVAAETSWMAALPGELLLHTTVGRDCDFETPGAGEGRLICIYPVDTATMYAAYPVDGVIGLTWHSYAGEGPWRVLIDTERLTDSADQQAVVAHEIGHAMGLEHSRQEHTLMFPSLRRCDFFHHCVRTQSTTPTQEDVRAWRHARYFQ